MVVVFSNLVATINNIRTSPTQTATVVMCVPLGRPASRWQRPGRHNWAVMGE